VLSLLQIPSLKGTTRFSSSLLIHSVHTKSSISRQKEAKISRDCPGALTREAKVNSNEKIPKGKRNEVSNPKIGVEKGRKRKKKLGGK